MAGALIKPIHKSRDKDHCVPLNYRDISLLCNSVVTGTIT